MNYEAFSQVAAVLAVLGQPVPEQANTVLVSAEKFKYCIEQARITNDQLSTESRAIFNLNEFLNTCIRN